MHTNTLPDNHAKILDFKATHRFKSDAQSNVHVLFTKINHAIKSETIKRARIGRKMRL